MTIEPAPMSSAPKSSMRPAVPPIDRLSIPSRLDLVRIEFRPMVQADFAMVARWIDEPEIARWWDHPGTLADVEEHYGPAVRGEEPVHYSIIEIGSRPAGFAEWYEVSVEQTYAGLVGPPSTTAGIDYALGSGFRDHGLGPLVIDALTIAALAAYPSAPRVVSAPVIPNERSWKALRRAGYRFVKEIDQPGEGPSYLHERSREHPGLRELLRSTFTWFENHSGWAPPEPETLADWEADGGCRAPDDCWSSVAGHCEHGLATWDTVLRYGGR